MSKLLLKSLVVFAGFLLFLLVPQNVFAAELTFTQIPNTGGGDNTAVIEVRVDPQSKNLNVVEGEIKFSGSGLEELSVQVENGKSILPIWTLPPEYNKDQRSIRFTGGVPYGFYTEGLLFQLQISNITTDDIEVSFTDGIAYENDGKGTKVAVSSTPLKISISKASRDERSSIGRSLEGSPYAKIILLSVIIVAITVIYVYKKNQK